MFFRIWPLQRVYARRNACENVKLEAPQVLVDPLTKQVAKAEFRTAFLVWDQAMMTQFDKEVVVPVNPNVCTSDPRVMDFTRMNPPEFHGSKVENDP